MSEKTFDQDDVVDAEIETLEVTQEAPPKTASPSRLPLILAGISLLAIVLGLGVGYLSWRDMHASLLRLDSALEQSNLDQQGLIRNIEDARQLIIEQQERLQEQERTFQTRTQSVLDQAGGLENARQRLEQRELELEDALRAVHRRIGSGSNQWMVAEAEYLMRVANHRLQLERDVGTALSALRAADQRLRDTGDPGWNKVREVLAEEISGLSGIADLDLVGIAASLSGLSNRVYELKILRGGVEARMDGGDGRPEAGDGKKSLETLLRDGWEGFKSVMVIRRHDKPVTAMVPPDQLYFVVQNLRLQLESARFALLRGDPQLFRSALSTADCWLREYFDNEDALTQDFVKQIASFEVLDIRPDLPDISRSLRLLLERDRELAGESRS